MMPDIDLLARPGDRLTWSESGQLMSGILSDDGERVRLDNRRTAPLSDILDYADFVSVSYTDD